MSQTYLQHYRRPMILHIASDGSFYCQQNLSLLQVQHLTKAAKSEFFGNFICQYY